jgi:DNA repair protein RadC
LERRGERRRFVTKSIVEAAKIIDIELLDHVIAGDAKADPLDVGRYSFHVAGLL